MRDSKKENLLQKYIFSLNIANFLKKITLTDLRFGYRAAIIAAEENKQDNTTKHKHDNQ